MEGDLGQGSFDVAVKGVVYEYCWECVPGGYGGGDGRTDLILRSLVPPVGFVGTNLTGTFSSPIVVN